MQKIERYGWTLFSQGPNGEANVTLVRELYAYWDPDKGDNIVWVHSHKVDIFPTAINRHYCILFQYLDEYLRRLKDQDMPQML